MRPKVILSVLGITGILLGAVFVFGPPVGSGSNHDLAAGDQVSSKMENSAATETTAIKNPDVSKSAATLAPGASLDVDEVGLTVTQDDTYVDARIDELADLGMTNDPDSLTTILSELTNRDPRIRKAALSAAIQFGSPNAIPALKDAVFQTDDPQEKVNLQNAIDFLKLPRLSDAHPPAPNAQQNAENPATPIKRN